MLPEKEMQPYGGYVDIQKTAASGQETFSSKSKFLSFIPRHPRCPTLFWRITAENVKRPF